MFAHLVTNVNNSAPSSQGLTGFQAGISHIDWVRKPLHVSPPLWSMLPPRNAGCQGLRQLWQRVLDPTLKRLKVRYIIARANDELHGSILEKIGADNVVYPEREMGIRAPHGMTLRDVSDYMSVVHGYGIAKLPALPYLVGGKRTTCLSFSHSKVVVPFLNTALQVLIFVVSTIVSNNK